MTFHYFVSGVREKKKIVFKTHIYHSTHTVDKKRCTSVRVGIESLSGGSCWFWETRAMRRSKSWSCLRFGGGSNRQLIWSASVATSCSDNRPERQMKSAFRQENIHRHVHLYSFPWHSWRSTHLECWQRLHTDETSVRVVSVSENTLWLFSEHPSQNLGTLAVWCHCH